MIVGEGVENTGEVLIAELEAQVSTGISPIAKPRQITIVLELPRTRSGKITRRLLGDVADGRDLGDTSTLFDPKVFDAIRSKQGGENLVTVGWCGWAAVASMPPDGKTISVVVA